ncbi:MAG: hypothetical protein OEX97_13385, partial [Acidimicrobiia bacterium]|nr:hypothetical protein [Acidimicrobiia bacterium]
PPPVDGIAGVACVDWASDFGIVPDGLGGYLFEGERIVFANGPTFDPFLSFNDEVLRDNVTFQRFLFVTQQTGGTGDELYRKMTAIVRWSPPNGFPREVRQVTFASAFEAPPSPILDGNIDFSGGEVSIRGFVGGTSGWWDMSHERPLLVDGTFMEGPSAHVRATSDYVSATDVVVSSPASEWVWSDPLTGFRSRIAANSFELASDDDFGTAAPPAAPDAFAQSVASWLAPGITPFPPNYALIGREWAEGGVPDHTQVASAVSRAQDPLDGLPHAELAAEGPGRFGIATVEYDPGMVGFYGEAIGSYAFLPYYHGSASNGTALEYDAVVDRFSTTDATRKITGQFDLRSEQVNLLVDEVYNTIDNKFLGWIRITMPSLSSTFVAGEAALPPTIASGNVRIQVWDSSGLGSYVDLLSPTDLDTIGGSLVIVDSSSPLLMTANLAPVGHPDLYYEVSIEELVVNGPVSSRTTYAAGATATVQVEFPPVVTGTVHYYVEDTVMGRVLFDYEMTFRLPGVTGSAAYINPDL